MTSSNKYIKSSLIFFSFILSIGLYLFFLKTTSSVSLLFIKLTQIYGLISVFYLLIILFPGPLYRIFPNFPFKIQYRSILAGLGISTFYFAFLHSFIGFFKLLYGFKGLGFLGKEFLLAVILGFLALLILALLAGTSFTWAMKSLKGKWKVLHRFVYLVGICIVIHVLILGSNFRDFTQPLALIYIILFTILIILESIRAQRYLLITFPKVPSRVFTSLISIIFLTSYYLLFILHESVIGGHIH